jgi:long-chain acyl-CoA synthetase
MLIEGRELEAPAPPLDELLRAGLEAAPDEEAMVSAEGRVSWRELEEAAVALAGSYLALGLAPGDRIASLMPNRIGLAIHYLACLKAGLVATPLNYRYTHREIDHALGVSGAAALLAHAERAEDLTASAQAGGLAQGTISYGAGEGRGGPRFEELLEGAPDAPPLTPPRPSDPAAIFFTSGRSSRGRSGRRSAASRSRCATRGESRSSRRPSAASGSAPAAA